MQATFVLASLPVFAALVGAYYWFGVAGADRLRLATLPAVGLVFAHLLLGRDLLIYGATVRLLNLGVLAVAFALVAATAGPALTEPDASQRTDTRFTRTTNDARRGPESPPNRLTGVPSIEEVLYVVPTTT